MLKKFLLAALWLPLMALAQSYPSPTFNNVKINGSMTISGGNGIGLGALAQQAANTVLANVTGSTGNVTAFGMPSCSTSSSALDWTSGSGFTCNTAINAASLGGNAANTYALLASPTFTGTPAAPTAATATNTTQLATTAYVLANENVVWAAAYGVKCDGSTNDTANLQSAWNAAAAAGKTLFIGGIGTGVCKFSSLTAPTPTAGEIGNRAGIMGSGQGVTELLSTVTGTSCAITLSATYGTNSDYNVKLSGFTLIGQGATSGYGLCLNSVTNLTVDKVWIQYFDIGVTATDSILLDFIDVTVLDATNGFQGLYGSNSHPNAWTFINPHLLGITQYGMYFVNPTDLNIFGGDYENNGVGNATASSIYIYGNPVDGTKGLNLSGGYFSINNGQADITIDNVSGAQNGVHTINGAEFQRVSNSLYVTNNVLVNNNGTGTTTLNVRGNGFQGFNTYVANSGRPYVAFTSPSSTNYVISSGGNWFQSSTETPNNAYWNETGWTSYTPTLSCASGTATASSATASYKRLTQKTIAVQIVYTMTTIGTCAGSIEFTLPTTANSANTGAGLNTSTNVAMTLNAVANSNAVYIESATGTIGIVAGQAVQGTLIYESK